MGIVVCIGLGVAGLIALRVQRNRRRAKNLPERLWVTIVSDARGENRNRIKS